jgi:hypothetical protein
MSFVVSAQRDVASPFRATRSGGGLKAAATRCWAMELLSATHRTSGASILMRIPRAAAVALVGRAGRRRVALEGDTSWFRTSGTSRRPSGRHFVVSAEREVASRFRATRSGGGLKAAATRCPRWNCYLRRTALDSFDHQPRARQAQKAMRGPAAQTPALARAIIQGHLPLALARS